MRLKLLAGVCCSIELDDDQSDTESIDSATDTFADIPLPSVTLSASTEPAHQPHTSSATSSSPTLDTIPLPTSPGHDKSITDNRPAVPSLENETTSKPGAAARTDESSSVASGDAVHAKTSIGTITVLLNRKMGPRLSKASVFDVPDDNAKEVNRKLVKLRRLKRLKKNKDGQNELDGTSVTGRKALQQRISEWKEELLNDQNFKLKHRDSKDAFVTETDKALVRDGADKQSNTADKGHATDVKDSTPLLRDSDIKSEAVDSKPTPCTKSDDPYMVKLYDSFMNVTSSNELAQLDWPREMIQETRLSPKLVYSCNPLYFSFRKLRQNSQQNDQSNAEPKKHKHLKKRKKSHAGKTEDQTTASKSAHKDTNTSEVKKDPTKSHKTLKKDSADQLEHTKMAKNSLERGTRNKKTTKSMAQADKPTKSSTSHPLTQSSRRKLSVAEDTTLKHGSRGRLRSTRPTSADGDTVLLSGTLKDTAKSRWDTSSDSETETSQPSACDWKTNKTMRSKVPVLLDQSNAKTRKGSPDNRSRSPSWSSHSSARSRKRSRHRSVSSSASSYSRTSSSYRSSSYSRRRRRRLTSHSSQSSCSYTDTASNYSRSSQSYSRSRSISHRRRRRSRSYSRSSRSRSFSHSRSPRRHHSGSQLRPHKAKSDWRTQAVIKRPRATETTSTLQTKPQTQPAKGSGNKGKNSSDEVKPASAPAESADVGVNPAEEKELKPADTKESAKATADAAVEDLKSIPTPEEHMQSIPLPVQERPVVTSSQSFIGPVLPSNHPLAHKQDIRLPPTAKFQRIGPNDPLVFRSMPPPPPPPASLTSPTRVGTSVIPPPRPPSPPGDDMEDDIAGDEDPIPQMLDVKTLKPVSFIPPEQDEQYGALRRQAELHARRQRIREETGMDIDEDDEDEGTDAVTEEQLADQAYLDEAAMFPTTPVIHVPQQHLVGQPLSTSVAMMASGAGLVPVQMVPAGAGGLVGIEPSLVSLVQPGQNPAVLAALARAQEEAEAEAQVRQQVAAAQAIAAAQRQRATELVQLLPSHLGVGAAGSPALATLQPSALSLQAIPVHALASQQPQQQLIQLPAGRVIGIPNVMPGGVQVIAQPQPQPAPLVIGPNGTILRLIR